MASGNTCCVTFVVYLLVFCNIVGGILLLVNVSLDISYQYPEYNYWNSAYSLSIRFEIAVGIISICLGFFLLFGAVKKNAGCVLVYLVLMIIDAVIITAMTIYYFLVSFGSSLGGFAVLIVPLVVYWAMVYYVYLFHKSLVEQSSVSSTNLDTDGSVGGGPYSKEGEEMA